MILERHGGRFVRSHQAEIRMPTTICHLLHANSNAGMNLLCIEAWR
ncbi:hypothetical protein CPter91_3449 [Collimonas pratensis]|uniref:Uncharacterized protein n=1 Tax=Collimonas pratensis TaxID=279113 RepID=A0A127Q7H0_9BURK|nr:hypothetical protein CPter91_3449 [Collimonas pratensis]